MKSALGRLGLWKHVLEKRVTSEARGRGTRPQHCRGRLGGEGQV